jgi:hypothetical protein
MSAADAQLKKLVREAINELGSVNKLAIEAGVPQPSLSLWLRGKQDTLSWKAIAKLLDYLQVGIK